MAWISRRRLKIAKQRYNIALEDEKVLHEGMKKEEEDLRKEYGHEVEGQLRSFAFLATVIVRERYFRYKKYFDAVVKQGNL